MNLSRPLFKYDAQDLRQEMSRFDEFCVSHSAHPHYTVAGPLRHGRTVWLFDEKEGAFKHEAVFPHCIQFARYLAGLFETTITRAYIHRLQPFEGIDPHCDVEPYHSTIDRYQLYLNWPQYATMEHKREGVWERDTVVWFNHSLEHSYMNYSTSDWYFMVVDLKYEVQQR